MDGTCVNLGALVNVQSQLLAYALGLAASPLPILALLVVMITPRARANTAAFLAGWVGAAIALTVLASILGLDAYLSEGASPFLRNATLALGIALVLGAGGALLFSTRRSSQSPRVLQAIDSIGPPGALLLGMSLVALNAKNASLALLGGVHIAATSNSTLDHASLTALFVAIASATLVLPALLFFVAGRRATELLAPLRAWMARNLRRLLYLVIVVIGFALVRAGLEPQARRVAESDAAVSPEIRPEARNH